MNQVLSTMRRSRLEYAIKREIDRQAIVIADEAVAHLVDKAATHIDGHFHTDDARGVAAEKAEKTLNPVITALAQASDGPISFSVCEAFLASPTVVAFPWTARVT